VPPEERFVPRFAAEPPQEDLPYGRWAERLRQVFLAECAELDTAGLQLGEPGEIAWHPDRTWHGRTYVPATSPTSGGYELFGYVRFVPGAGGGQPGEFSAHADFTAETAQRNPDWQMDLCEEVIGAWRGHNGAVAAMTLVWGHPLVSGGRVATAELADLAVDQCELVNQRFTLIAPDDYRHDLLEIKLFGARGEELARESLYAGEDETGEDEIGEDEIGGEGGGGEDEPGAAETG
jgi:hypothetical protein